jgi:cytochrome c oxidase cbb3-type subunit 4
VDQGTFHGLWTLLLIILFIGIFIWAYSDKRKKGFDQAARLALEEDDKPTARAQKESKNG